MKAFNTLAAMFCTLPLLINAHLDPLRVAQRQASMLLPPCKLCRTFVDSFIVVNCLGLRNVFFYYVTVVHSTVSKHQYRLY